MNAPPATKSAAKGPREGRGLRAAVAVARALALFKLLVWWVFLPAFGFLCVRHWLLIPALLLSLGGTAIGLQIVRHAEPGTFMGSLPMRLLGGVALLINVVVGLSALLLFAVPFDAGWTLVPGSSGWSDPVPYARPGGGVVVVTGGPDKGSWWRDPGSAAYEPRGLPGLPGWYLAEDPIRGRLWVAPQTGDVLTFYALAEGRWLEIPAPVDTKQARGLAMAGERLVLATGEGVFWTDEEVDGWVLAAPGRFTALAVDPAGERLLAIGPRWLASDDRGAGWRPIEAPPATSFGADVAIAGDGRVYAIDGGMFGGALWSAAAIGAPWEARAAPAGDLRVIVVDPRASERLVVGTWGEGVFRSDDGGRTWAALGLESVSVRALAVDFDAGTIHAGSSNLTLRGGVFVGGLMDAGAGG